MVKTPRFQYKGLGFDPTCCAVQLKKKERKDSHTAGNWRSQELNPCSVYADKHTTAQHRSPKLMVTYIIPRELTMTNFLYYSESNFKSILI